METTKKTCRSNSVSPSLLKFRKRLTNEIADLEANGYEFVGSTQQGKVFTRCYIHKRTRKHLNIEIDFDNFAATVRVDSQLSKIIT